MTNIFMFIKVIYFYRDLLTPLRLSWEERDLETPCKRFNNH